MTVFRDLWFWFNAMGTLPWTIKLWACLHPLPQLIGGLIFIQTLPGTIILGGRVLSGIIASQIHKRAPFSKLMGPVGHVHWLLIVPYLVHTLTTGDLSPALFWFIGYVVATTMISAVIDVFELIKFVQRGHAEYKR